MSLKGNLEDVSVVDVIQLIYIGGRTGTLAIQAPAAAARFGFQRGRMSNAWRTGAAKLGELLIASGLISRAALASALAAQEQEVPRRSVGQILIGNGIVTEAAVNELLVRHFTHLLREIITWRRGVFDFTFDDVWPLEDLAAFPGDTGAKVAVDTQMMLLEALSHVEELRPDGQHTAADDGGMADEFTASTVGGPAPDGLRMREASEASAPVTPAPIPAPPRLDTSRIGFETVVNFPRVQLITTDLSLAERLRSAMQDPTARVMSVLAREAGSSLPGEPPPIVVMDVRGSALSMERSAPCAAPVRRPAWSPTPPRKRSRNGSTRRARRPSFTGTRPRWPPASGGCFADGASCRTRRASPTVCTRGSLAFGASSVSCAPGCSTPRCR